MAASTDIAARLIRFEQQLTAYQQLHRDELAELRHALQQFRRDIAAIRPVEPLRGLPHVAPGPGAFLAREEADPQT